jgi:prepilin-type N-terminal cleavage/methylation domain-containing protein
MNPTGPFAALRRTAPRRSRSRAGFSLVEVSITLAVVALVFIGLIGLLGVGVANNQTSSEQTTATNIVSTILADLRSTPTAYAASAATVNSARFSIPMSSVSAPTSATSPLSGVNPVYLYFDANESALNSTPYATIPAAVPSSAAYLASIYLVKIATGPNSTASTVVPAAPQNTYLLRCVITWPAQTSTHPAGNVDVVTEFLSH